MSNDELIKRKRESAGQFNVSTPDDQTPIVDMVPMDHVLLIVKEAGIYQFQFADQIDPNRTNVNLPDVLQKLLGYGAGDEFVGRILLTAKKLFKAPHIPEVFDHKSALALSLKIVTEVAGLKDIEREVRKTIDLGVAAIANQNQGRAIMLPTVRDLVGRVHSFVLRADHCRQHLLDLAKIFYGSEPTNFEQVKSVVITRHGTECSLGPLYDEIDKLARFVRNTRHCVEHRRSDQRLEVRDFSLGPDGKVIPPTIEILHRETPEPTTDLLGFMEVIERSIIDATEAIMVHLCEWNCAPVGGIMFGVIEIPQDRRGKSFVRYTYGGQLGDHLAMF